MPNALLRHATAGSLTLALAACGDSNSQIAVQPAPGGDADAGTDIGVDAPAETVGLAVLGGGTHSVDNVDLRVIADASDALDTPRDLAFNPEDMTQLWVSNTASEAMVVLTNVDTPQQQATAYAGWGHQHFFAQPSAIAFGQPGVLGSIHETDQMTQGPNGTPGDFMGPATFSTNLDEYDAGHASHLDMLHNSPNGMGIAWERDNVFWVFDGYHSSLTRYDFQDDHGLGGDDHSDGIVARFVEGSVTRVPGIPSHMEFDHRTRLLYVNDTGSNRVLALDTTTGQRAGNIFPNYDESEQYLVTGAQVDLVIDGTTVDGMSAPSGLILDGDVLYISDNASSTIFAFTLDGELIDWLPTGLPEGGLMGMAMDEDGNIAFVDALSHLVYKLSPRSE